MKKILFIALISSVSFAAQSPIQFSVQGIDGDMKKNVVEKLTAESKHSNFDAWYARSEENINEAMAPYGYFTPSIKRIQAPQGQGYAVRFIIAKGQAVVIKSVNVKVIGDGKSNPDIIAVLKKDVPTVGSILYTPQYEKFKSSVLEIANEQGYIKSYWENSRIKIDLANHTATINLTLQTKSRYYFGPVSFSQTEYAYAPDFMNRFSLSAPKGYFSSKKLVDYQQQLSMSHYFKEVNLAPDLSTTSSLVPLNARVTAPPAKKYTFGLGYSTWSGPRFLTGASFRHLNDEGHYLDTQLKLSPIISQASAKYYIPGHNPLTQQWVIGANLQRFLPKTGTSSSGTFLVGYNIKEKNWQSDLALNYLIEQYKLPDQNSRKSIFLYPSWNISSTVTDDPIYPNNGYNVNLLLRGTSAATLSTTSFLQGLLKTKYLFSVIDGTRLIARAEVGYTVVDDISKLPISLRFYTGGSNSVRGYKDSSLGPGKYLLLGSLELQQRIHGNWEAAIFYDQGKAVDHFNDPWNKSIGVGAIYASIIGPVKAYVVRDISLPSKPYRLEFSFGPEF